MRKSTCVFVMLHYVIKSGFKRDKHTQKMLYVITDAKHNYSLHSVTLAAALWNNIYYNCLYIYQILGKCFLQTLKKSVSGDFFCIFFFRKSSNNLKKFIQNWVEQIHFAVAHFIPNVYTHCVLLSNPVTQRVHAQLSIAPILIHKAWGWCVLVLLHLPLKF